MKKLNIIKASLLCGVLVAVASCKEDNYYIIDPSGIPQASDYTIKVDVDQSTNQVTLAIKDANGNDPKGVYPVWKVYTKTNPVISTRLVYTDLIGAKGDYNVEMQVGNRNGISEGVRTATIHIENTLVDFGPHIKFLTDNDSRSWMIAASEPNHLACGEPGSDGTGWWNASPNEKAQFGVYDNRMIFTDNGGSDSGLYTFDPGDAGTVYINTGITDLPPYSDSWQDQDYCAPVSTQSDVPFNLSVEGEDVFLTLAPGTFMAYLPFVEQYNNPKWKVLSLTKNKMELVCSNSDIAWHYILVPEDADGAQKPFEGFKYDSEFNLWKDANLVIAETFFADGSWTPITPQPDVELSNERIFLHTPAGMGNDQWQGQLKIDTDIVLSAGSTYDFSMYLNAPVDSKVTVKPHLIGDDGVFLSAETIPFTAYGSYYYFSDVKGFDGPVQLVLDFGGYPDTDFEIKKIVLKDHANDDGTVLPSETPEEEPNVSWVNYDSEDNLFTHINGDVDVNFWYAPGWNQIADPALTRVGNREFTFTLPEATSDQWQAQFNFKTGITIDPEKFYDVKCIVSSSTDMPGVTFKLTHEQLKADGSGDTEDVGELVLSREAVEAYDDHVFSFVNMPGIATDNLKVVFDFGGNPANSKVTIKEIIIQEHREGPSTPTANWVDVNSADNLFNGADYNITYFYAPGWAEITPPDTQIDGNNFTLTFPEATSDQWQNQFALHTNISTSADKNYDFRVTFYSDKAIPKVTFKCVLDGGGENDSVFYMADQVEVPDYEEVTYQWVNCPGIDMDKMAIFFDFGGNPANTKVNIKDIIVQEHR